MKKNLNKPTVSRGRKGVHMTRGIIDYASNHTGFLVLPASQWTHLYLLWMLLDVFRRTCSSFFKTQCLLTYYFLNLCPNILTRSLELILKMESFHCLGSASLQYEKQWKFLEIIYDRVFLVLRSIKMIWRYTIKCLRLVPLFKKYKLC